MNDENERAVNVLLVEDSDDEALLTRKGLERSGLPVRVLRVSGGEECLRCLRRQGEFAGGDAPDLVLLDLNMPGMTGREVMAEIVSDETIRHMPVVVLTTSDAESDVRTMYRLRCSSYVTKPVDYDEFCELIEEVCRYWISTVVRPTPGAADA